MTFEEALIKVSNMTDKEKGTTIPAMALMPDTNEEYDKYIEFLVLELDAETQAPTDNILWIEVPESTLEDGTYKTGDITSFCINGEGEKFYQILDYDIFDMTDRDSLIKNLFPPYLFPEK